MRVGVLGSSESWYLKDLQRAAESRHDIIPISFSQISAALGGEHTSEFNSGECDLANLDVLLVRTMPPGSLEQVVFRMDVLARIEATGCPVVNPPRAIEAAVDKYLALAKLNAAGLPTPRTVVCQTVEDAIVGFDQLGGDVVVKPLFGSEGRGITRVNDENIALRVFKTLAQMNAIIYLQRYIKHNGYDIRLLLIGDRVVAMRRRNSEDWRTNVSRGATSEPFEPDEDLVAMARRAAGSVGAPLAGVDVLPDREGRNHVLEVNAVPGWKAMSRTQNVDVAALVLEFLAQTARGTDSF